VVEVDAAGRRAIVEVVIHEGRKHIVRRLLAAVGHPVERLVRTAVADVRLGQLSPGTVRELSGREPALLYRSGEPGI
jgi:23S rRNA pseudouridine2605 synthase